MSAASTTTAKKSRFVPKKERKRHQRKDRAVFIPRRCEGPSCTSGAECDTLKRCSRCTLVMYCCRACQVEDYKRHKVECTHLAELGLWGLTFDASELEHFPLRTAPMTDREEAAEIPRDAVCGVCGDNDNGRVTRSRCCGMVICDKQEDYQMFSYSREFCDRSHDRYTRCGSHSTERHRAPDWRSCEECKGEDGTVVDSAGRVVRSWYSTNAYNFTPGLMESFPKGSMITTDCRLCHKRIATGFEAHSSKMHNGEFITACSGKC
ncbi:unnamed protein product [Sphacelaria rigidula]